MDESAEEVILTESCSKSNKQISYLSGETITIKQSNIDRWTWFKWSQSILKDVFLPKGYPDSVSSDYLEYQIWDTCQAFCSSISGTLAMSAVLKGIGVGSETATPISAAVTWLIKDGTGMIGSILFAWLKGSKLDEDCKKWRLFADILNDVAMLIELSIPFKMEYSVQMMCIATIFKALVGTAGSSTRAALITHQAIKGNIADVSAKDGSQEIFTNLCAFVFGIFILKNLTETKEIWTVMCTATLFHLIFNYNAVKCLKMNIFNSERYCLSLRTYLPTSCVPTVAQTNYRESVFLLMGVTEYSICGFSFSIGASMRRAIKNIEVTTEVLTAILALFKSKRYLILPNIKKKKLYVAFRTNFRAVDVLKAYFHACLLGISINILLKNRTLRILQRNRKNSPIFRLQNILSGSFNIGESKCSNFLENVRNARILEAYQRCADLIDKEFDAFCYTCEEMNWNTKKHLISVNDWRAQWAYKEPKNITFTLKNKRTSSSSAKQVKLPKSGPLVY